MVTATDNLAVILAGARTPFGKFGGALKNLTATDLGVLAAQAAVTRAGIPPESIDHVIFGNALQTSSVQFIWQDTSGFALAFHNRLPDSH